MRISTAGIVRRGETILVALRNPGTSIGESWEFPGGKARDNETPAEALKREFREELGVEAEVGPLEYEGRFSNREMDYRLMAFSVELPDTEFILSEHQEVRWVAPENLVRFPMASSDRQILDFLISSSV